MADSKSGRDARVTHDVHCGESVVFIELTQSRWAIVDADVWPRIEREYGTRWMAIGDGQGHVYAAKKMNNGAGEFRLVTLARAVMEAEPGDRVECMNYDSLDCRRSNLDKLETVAALKRRREYAEKRARYLAAQRDGVSA